VPRSVLMSGCMMPEEMMRYTILRCPRCTELKNASLQLVRFRVYPWSKMALTVARSPHFNAASNASERSRTPASMQSFTTSLSPSSAATELHW